MKNQEDSLASRIARVVESDNCSGCGVCAGLFPGIEMELTAQGFMRPAAAEGRQDELSSDEAIMFDKFCPGKNVSAPVLENAAKTHPVFGRAIKVWEGWATDPAFRRAGSSGGVLTTISSYLTHKYQSPAQMVAMDSSRPSRSIPVRITTRDEALKAAGSRYAPVSVGSRDLRGLSSVTGKPCEISAIRASMEGNPESPFLLSFFCAGTPSQKATESLIGQLGHSVDNLRSTKYRGDGWPGQFEVASADGTRASMSYEESWGEVLGKQLQERCKICVDGTGESADVAVGDFWESDEAGYPVFEDTDGRSVVIARSTRGLRIIEECLEEGLLELRPINLDDVAKIQPLQVKRRLTLPGRLLGRILTGQEVPKYRGYNLTAIFLSNIGANIRAAGGTARRRFRSLKNKV